MAHLLITVVHGRHLQDDRQIPSRLDGNGEGWQLHTHQLCEKLVGTQSVVHGPVLPVLQLHQHVDVGLELDGGHTEQAADIHHANASQLHIVANELGGGAHQAVVEAPADFHRIVGNEAVATLDELNGGLALAHAGLAHEQHALAVHLHQHAVAGDGGRQRHPQVGDEGAHEIRRILLGAQQNLVVLLGRPHALRVRLQAPGDNHRRGVIGKQLVKALHALLCRALLQVRPLHQAQQLHTLPVKVVEITRHLEAGTVHVLDGDLAVPVALRAVQHLKMKLVNDGAQTNGRPFSHDFTPFPRVLFLYFTTKPQRKKYFFLKNAP